MVLRILHGWYQKRQRILNPKEVETIVKSTKAVYALKARYRREVRSTRRSVLMTLSFRVTIINLLRVQWSPSHMYSLPELSGRQAATGE